MTSAMEHHLDEQEEKMRILFDDEEEDFKINGKGLENDTELLIIEDLSSPVTTETGDFNCRSDEAMSPDPDRSRSDSNPETLEDLTPPCLPDTENSSSDTSSPLQEEVEPTLSQVHKNGVKSPDQVNLSVESSALQGTPEDSERKQAFQGSDDVGSNHSTGESDEGECNTSQTCDDELQGSLNEFPEDADNKEDDTGVFEASENCVSNISVIREEVASANQPITCTKEEEEITSANQPIIKEEGETGSENQPIIKEEEEATSENQPFTKEEERAPSLSVGEGVDVIEGENVSLKKDEDVSSNKNDDAEASSQGLSSGMAESVNESLINRGSNDSITLTIDSVPVDSDSLTSIDLPLTPLSQGSCDPPLTPSSIDDSLHEEVKSLRSELQQAHSMVKQLQSVVVKQRVQNSHVVSVLKMQLKQKEEEYQKQQVKSDKQMGEVLAHLLLLEGQLKKEQIQIRSKMAEKEKLVQKQQDDIKNLTEVNQRLLQAVHDACGRKGKNGVLLLDNIGDIDVSGSAESLDSPTSKSPPPGKTAHKGRWGSMKDKMTRKHRSSLDLSDTEFDISHGLLHGRQYGSQESLLRIGRNSKEKRENRDKKCRSIPGYPERSLMGLLEVPEVGEGRLDNFRVLSSESGTRNQEKNQQNTENVHINGSSLSNSDPSAIGLLSAISMPILSQTDKNANQTLAKERPKAISSIEHISSSESIGSVNNGPQTDLSTQPPKSPGATSTNSSFSDSNPFKNLKTILKRKGSKNKGKKRSVTMAECPSQEYQAAVKKHFEKYDMS